MLWGAEHPAWVGGLAEEVTLALDIILDIAQILMDPMLISEHPFPGSLVLLFPEAAPVTLLGKVSLELLELLFHYVQRVARVQGGPQPMVMGAVGGKPSSLASGIADTPVSPGLALYFACFLTCSVSHSLRPYCASLGTLNTSHALKCFFRI